MTLSNLNIPALLGARICHDLISPVGAISNGLELLSLVGDANGPEAELVGESVSNANARLKFFRLAFGLGTTDHVVSADEISDILADFYTGIGFEVTFHGTHALVRQDAKLLLLQLLCCESGMGRRGRINISDEGVLVCQGERGPDSHPLWSALTGHSDWPDDLAAADVHYPILAEALNAARMQLAFREVADGYRIWTEAAPEFGNFTHEPYRPLRQGT